MGERIAVKKFQGVYYREAAKATHNGVPDKSFCYSYQYGGKKHWVTVGWASRGVTAADANEQRQEALNRVNRGEVDSLPGVKRPDGITCDQAVEAWAEWAASAGKYTAPRLSIYKRHVRPILGSLPLDKITIETLDSLKATLLGGTLAPASALAALTTVRMSINFAISRRLWAGTNPLAHMSGFTMPRQDNCGERFLTPDEARRLLAELQKRSPVWHDMAYVALHTGMRLTELIKLMGQDINEDRLTAIITAKGGRRQPVLLTPKVLEVLLRNRRQPHEPVFRNKNGAAIVKAGKPFNKAVEACGLNEGVTDSRYKFWFHSLRHTFASWLAQSGVTIYELMLLMRHDKIENTLRYAHLMPGQQRDYLEIIPRTLKIAL